MMVVPMEEPRDPSRAPLSPKIIDEVRDLHLKSASRAQTKGNLKRRRARRALREARAAENDLLRVLGFKSYEQFEKTVEHAPPKPSSQDSREIAQPAALRIVASRNREASIQPMGADLWLAREEQLDALVGRVAAVEEELAEAKFAIKTIRNASVAQPSTDVTDLGLDELRLALHHAAIELESFAQRVRLECEHLEHLRNATVAMMRDAIVTMQGLRQIASLHDD